MKIKYLFTLATLIPLFTNANSPEPSSALEFQQTDTRVAVANDNIKFYMAGTEALTLDANGKIAIGSTDPQGYDLRVAGSFKNTTYTDIGYSRPTGANSEGLFIKGTDGNGVASFQLALESHSGSHGILFNAYRNDSQVNGNIVATGNTSFTHDVGNHSNGAGLIHFYGNGGGMGFYISEESTGADTDVVWGTPKLHLQRNGNVGINTMNPASSKLHVYRDATTSGWGSINTSNAGFRVEDSSSNLYVDGNSLISDGNLLIGTHVSTRLTFGTNNTERMRITSGGKVGIGLSSDPSYKLDVNGTINADTYRADGVVVWPDYVFEDSYELNDLEKVEKFIEKNNHLPEIPSAAEVKEDGIDLVDIQVKLLQKIEELTLYVIEQNKRIEQLSKQNESQQKEIEKLKK